MTSASRRESTNELLAKIDEVTTGHDTQRTTPAHAALPVDGTLNTIEWPHGTFSTHEPITTIPWPTSEDSVVIARSGEIRNTHVRVETVRDEPSLWARILRRLQEEIRR